MKNVLKGLGLGVVAGAGIELGQRIAKNIAYKHELRKGKKLLKKIEKNKVND